MQERYSVPETASLPQPHELTRLLQQYREVSLKYTLLPAGYLEMLDQALENHTFLHWETAGLILLTPAVSTVSILARQEALYHCAQAFRQQAFQLTELLLEARAVPIGKRHDWRELMQLKMRQARGAVNEEWTYYLHGWECRFEHTGTGQVVEVIVANLPECGCLDAYFFLTYINTTAAFAELRQWLGNEDANVGKALRILRSQGVLQQLAAARDDRNLFAG
ncbi:DUF6896 domain-containing protein [Hymenobacter persicinus]|uniref:DUF6896 domain-containing protein n=1 Tax=Hymenobacter persicinus TaxID=2025506 RepID=A0A4V1ZAI4_9BACT|nr:hypothetical protein [Hymenobacter persicinus]RYU78256.1 hypothetical protein EWM57_14955 [Hymenobacter persicinus]